MHLGKLNARPARQEDVRQLELWRRDYWDADLEIPKDYNSIGVETAVAERADGSGLVASLTATRAVILDPLIHDPAAPELDLVAAIYLLERILSYEAQAAGAVDAYIAVPDKLAAYQRIVEKAGYIKTVEKCSVYRRPLRPDTVPLLGDERDAASVAA